MLVKYLYAAMMVMSLLVFYQTAQGYTHTGYRLPSKTVTYSCGSPELRQAMQAWANVSGLVDGGCSTTAPDITLEIVPDILIPPPILGYGGAGRIWLAKRAEHNYGVMLHEVGHAIGLGHSAETLGAPYEQRQAAMFYLCCNPLNSDDIAGIQALYGPEVPTLTRRSVVPMVSQ